MIDVRFNLSSSPRVQAVCFSEEVLGPLEQQSAFAFKNILLAIGLELFDLIKLNLVNCLVELPHDVETIENVQGLWSSSRNDLEVRRPHVAADEMNCSLALFSLG